MISLISIDDGEKWDAVVRSFKEYDVYYLWGYSKAFYIHGDGEPFLFYFEDDKMRALNVVMRRDISKDEHFAGKLPQNSYFDLTTPYGYGGFLIEGEVSEQSLRNLNDKYSEFCRRRGIISEFVRFHPILQNNKNVSTIYNTTRLGKTISITLNSKEQIWSDLISQNRNKVRKAKKTGVKIYWGRSPELFREFIQVYNSTMDKDRAREYYYFGEDFYRVILNDLKYNTLIFYAVYENKIIGMAIMLLTNHQMHYHLSGSYREYQHLAPINLLLFEAACWGSEQGYKSLNLGGGLGSREDNLYIFKSGFNRNSDNTFVIGRKIFDGDKYEELVNVRKQEADFDENTRFFPVYRATFGEIVKGK